MNSELASACRCFGLYDDQNNIVGFAGILHQPHGVNKKIKRCSRIVILPDYQGIGLGYKFLTIIADLYAKQGYTFSIVTSAKNFICKLNASQNWKMIRLSAERKSKSKKSRIDYNRKSVRDKCKTASFVYIKNINDR